MTDTLAVASTFILLARESGQKINAIKAQRLVYYAHGWSLALLNTPLISEPVEAWEYGPVIRSLYQEFLKHGTGDISLIASATRVQNDIAIALIKKTWEVYGQYTDTQLSNLAHAGGTPWHQAWTQSRYKAGVCINNELIEAYFAQRLQASTAID